jgi:hypothetical protein
MRVVTPFRVACVGITFVLAVNVSSILPFVFETASSPSAPGRLEARPSRASASVVAPAAGAAATGARPTELATAAATASAEPAACVGRKPYHVILTATSQVYQQWQCRVMYRHWLKQKALDPKGACTEMTGFTRLVASAGGRADGVEDEVPTLFVLEYTPEELNRFHGYRVINRPYSIVQLLKLPYWRERVRRRAARARGGRVIRARACARGAEWRARHSSTAARSPKSPFDHPSARIRPPRLTPTDPTRRARAAPPTRPAISLASRSRRSTC